MGWQDGKERKHARSGVKRKTGFGNQDWVEPEEEGNTEGSYDYVAPETSAHHNLYQDFYGIIYGRLIYYFSVLGSIIDCFCS